MTSGLFRSQKRQSNLHALPSVVQFRLCCGKGLFKGCLLVTDDPALCPWDSIAVRPSMKKAEPPVRSSGGSKWRLFVNNTFERPDLLLSSTRDPVNDSTLHLNRYVPPPLPYYLYSALGACETVTFLVWDFIRVV